MCIFRVNAGIVTVKTLYSSANTPLTLKMNGFLALMCWKVIQGRPRHSFSINVTQNIFKSALCWELWSVCHRESFQTMDRRGFRCFMMENLSGGCLPSTVYGPQLRGRSWHRNEAVWGHTLGCEGAHVTLIFKAVWCSCWKDRISRSCGVFYPLEARPGRWL